jgi:hypothetical protein
MPTATIAPEKMTDTGAWRHCVSVGQPELEGNDRRLDQQRGNDQAECRFDERIAAGRRDRVGQRGKVERAGPRVD